MSSSESALLVIDMQQGLFKAPNAPYAASIILSNICLLIAKARQAEVPVFFARHIGSNDSPFNEHSPLTRLISEIVVNEKQDVVFTKKFPSCFKDTGLHLKLRQKGIKQLIIAGMKTEYCVDTTCRAASELGFSVVLISDAHTTVDNEILTAEKIIGHHNQTLAGPFVTLATAVDCHFSL